MEFPKDNQWHLYAGQNEISHFHLNSFPYVFLSNFQKTTTKQLKREIRFGIKSPPRKTRCPWLSCVAQQHSFIDSGEEILFTYTVAFPGDHFSSMCAKLCCPFASRLHKIGFMLVKSFKNTLSKSASHSP